MAQRTTLTEKQALLLKWIAEGCHYDVIDNNWYRISAAALGCRGLVEVSGNGTSRKATITSAGRAYLARVDSDNPPIARQANVSVTQQLVDDVMAAGGVLRVKRKNYYDPDSVDYAYRARLAERYDKVPNPVEALSSQGADESLGDGVGVGSCDRRLDHADALVLKISLS
jgi:hypothetical protein